MSKAVIYLRVSTEEQAEKGFSLYAQREECNKKAQEHGCDNILEFVDEGVSGSILERPMLMNAMDMLKNEKIDFFICYDGSRLSRNVSHQLILIDSIKKYGTKLIFVRNNYEDTAEGRFQITIMAAVDEYERARLKIRTELGKRAKAKQKQLTHNPCIYGYDFDVIKDILTINEEQAQIVKLIYNWLLEDGIGPAEIAEKLNKMQIPSMRNKKWNRVTINRMLNNFSYTGTLYIRRYDTRDYRLNKFKKKVEKVKVTQKPKDQWIPINIPSIVDVDTWHKAKMQLDKAKRLYKKGKKEEFLLSGLIRCGVCGSTLFGRCTNKGDVQQNKYYCCTNKYNYSITKPDRCKSRLYKAEDIEKAVWNKIKTLILNEERVKDIINCEKPLVKRNDKTKIVGQLIIRAKDEKQRLISLYQKGIVDEAELSNRIKQITKTIDELMKEQLYIEVTKNEIDEIHISNVISRMESYLENLNTLNKNKLLHIIIKEIIITNNTLRIIILIPQDRTVII